MKCSSSVSESVLLTPSVERIAAPRAVVGRQRPMYDYFYLLVVGGMCGWTVGLVLVAAGRRAAAALPVVLLPGKDFIFEGWLCS